MYVLCLNAFTEYICNIYSYYYLEVVSVNLNCIISHDMSISFIHYTTDGTFGLFLPWGCFKVAINIFPYIYVFISYTLEELLGQYIYIPSTSIKNTIFECLYSFAPQQQCMRARYLLYHQHLTLFILILANIEYMIYIIQHNFETFSLFITKLYTFMLSWLFTYLFLEGACSNLSFTFNLWWLYRSNWHILFANSLSLN